DSNTTGTQEQQSLIQQWIDFCWQPKPANEISLFSNAASPIVTTLNPANIPQDVRENPVLLPDNSVLDKSEFLQPLRKAVDEEYQALWKEIRTVRG
ncbi:polyamine ABC transporter substrate-binding protein, partial [Trichocoleus sp. ST-U3]